MKNKAKKYGIIMSIVALVLVSILAIQVNAEEPTTGSITIIAHEQQNGDTTTNPPMEGIEYTIYKVDETCEDTRDANNYIEENQIAGISKITGEDGTVVFDNLELGRYFVDVTSVSDGAIYDEYYSDFLIDIPMTNAEGTGWDYDITVEPKFQTAFGNLELTKVDNVGNPIESVTFKVQVTKEAMKIDTSIDELFQSEWIDYIPDGQNKPLTLTTDNEGKIYLNNLPTTQYDGGDHIYYSKFYRLVEVFAPNGYIINNIFDMGYLPFVVLGNGRISSEILELMYNAIQNDQYTSENVGILCEFIPNVSITDNLTSITYVNEKPNIVKKVQNGEGEFVDNIGANLTDRLTFKVTADIPMSIAYMKTYKITDELPDGIILDRNSIKVEGTTADGNEIISEDMYTLSQDGLELTFDTSKMYNVENDIPKYNNIIITYEAAIDKDNVVIGGNGNINTATLEYTNKINEDLEEESTTTTTDTAEVHTGGVLLEKVEKGNTSTKLAGAKFKIATTKDNAENGIFVQDENGTDIEVTTGENGQAVIEGLKYADDGSDTSYWLVETQAPSYLEDGKTKYYNLLKAPLEVQVGSTTHESAVQIENGKGFELPETGSIGLIIFLIAGISIMSTAYVLNKKQIKE